MPTAQNKMSFNAQRPASNVSILLQAQRYVLGADKALVLPCLSRPRLIVPASGPKICWRLSAFYPAFKLKAKCWCLLQRVRCAAALAERVYSQKDETFRLFIDEILPRVTHTAVLIGTAGPHQKIIVQLWRGNKVAGYVKLAATPDAGAKIRAEAAVLECVPQSMGPRLLKVGVLAGHPAMILSPVTGAMLRAQLPNISEVGGQMSELRGYLDQLQVSDELFEIDTHPAIVRLRKHLADAVTMNPDQLSTVNEQLDSLLELLRRQYWPVVIQHGDFAPWNVLRRLSSGICAIDWEEGSVEGFPHFDLIHYVSQTAALVEKWPPERCVQYLMCGLSDLDEPARRAVIKLGLIASWVMLQRSLDGHHWILDWKEKAWRAVDEF